MKGTDVMRAVSMRLDWPAWPHSFLYYKCYLYAPSRTPGLMLLIMIYISCVKKAWLTAKFTGRLITRNGFFIRVRVIFIVWNRYVEYFALLAEIRFQSNPCQIYGWQIRRDVFSSENLGFLLSVFPHWCFINILFILYRRFIYIYIPPPFHDATALRGPGPSHCRGFTIILRHTAHGRTPLDEWSARYRDLWHHTTLQTPWPRRGSNPQS